MSNEPFSALNAESISELREARAQIDKRPDNVLGLLLRGLSREEIAIMEARGCRADDWELIRVAENFDAFRVRRTHLTGNCVLGSFDSSKEILPGLELPTGIFDCTLHNCQVGNNCLLENVRYIANTIIEHQAIVFDVGSISCDGSATFGCNQEIGLAIETGGREVPVWPEMTVPAAAEIAARRGDKTFQEKIQKSWNAYIEAIKSPCNWIRRNAIIRHTSRLHDVYIGHAALIDHAQNVVDTCIYSNEEESVSVSSGSSVNSSVVQWGCSIGGNAIVQNTVLLEHSGADQHATIEESVIGPNSKIAKGEVTASLVGPFVGYHHQSLLIAAFWPEGKGNIAYGAMVGSNHTSRAPDQEIWPGEGVFFGLGSSIRFPANYQESPYSVISAGTATLPQKVAFPFSLIGTPQETVDGQNIPRAFNELLPAWAIEHNAYGLVRMERKLKKRDNSKRHAIEYKVFRPEIMEMVLDALTRLESVKERKEVYLEEDISGIGKNFIREEIRVKSIEIYRQSLLRYALRVRLAELEGYEQLPGSVEVATRLIDRFMSGSDVAQQMDALITEERITAEKVERSKQSDDKRGVRIIPGYEDAHTAASEDDIVQKAWQRVAKTEARVTALREQIS